MLKIRELSIPGYERVIEGKDPYSGLHCFIAIHSTRLGPALGGVRIFPYPDSDSALNDALHLAEAMTYKTALAQIGLGGGKSVIIAPPNYEKMRIPILQAFGAVVDTLKGDYIAAEDVGSSDEDMLVIRSITPYVSALPTATSSGDPSHFTAWGLWRGMHAVAEMLWDTPSLQGRTIAIQGLGHVGAKIADILFWHGAHLILCDHKRSLLEDLCHHYGAKSVAPEAFTSVECDILCPCAMGGTINSTSVTQLQCQAIAGSANNQLTSPEDAQFLHERGILYAPDYVINAGGIINASAEFNVGGYDPWWARVHAEGIYVLLKQIFIESKRQNSSPAAIADALAKYNLAEKIGKRTTPINFTLGE